MQNALSTRKKNSKMELKTIRDQAHNPVKLGFSCDLGSRNRETSVNSQMNSWIHHCRHPCLAPMHSHRPRRAKEPEENAFFVNLFKPINQSIHITESIKQPIIFAHEFERSHHVAKLKAWFVFIRRDIRGWWRLKQ
jgi:hypothetical protein